MSTTGSGVSPPPERPPAGGAGGFSFIAFATTALCGALLVVISVALAGSPVAIATALVVTMACGAVWLAAWRWRRRHAAHPRRAILHDVTTRERPPDSGDAPRTPPMPRLPVEEAPVAREASKAAREAPEAPLAHDLAAEAVRDLHAPAAAVLIPRGRRLISAGTAGDWGLARRIQQEHDASDAAPGMRPPAAPESGNDDPPEFALDDMLPRLLGLYPRALPFERWHELGDVPPALLPLVALADRGAAVAVALRHRRRLAGLWVLARRPGDQRYTDAELLTLERLAQQAAPALARALPRDG